MIVAIGIIVFIIGFFITMASSDELGYSILGTIAYLLSIVCIIMNYEKEPKAIDVYRGLTTLEITYRDDIPTDSTVIYEEVSNTR